MRGDGYGIGRRGPHRQPFATFTPDAARRYEGWYHTESGARTFREERALLARLLRSVPEARSLVEIGCGTGTFSRWFAARGLRTLGVDVAPAMLAVARDADPGGSYARAAAERLPLRDAGVDLAAFVTSLEFIAEPDVALREAARVARRALLLGVLNLASPLGLRRVLAARRGPSLYRGARFYTPWGLEATVRRALGSRVCATRWQTAVWPDRVPARARRLPLGAFIGMLVVLREEERR